MQEVRCPDCGYRLKDNQCPLCFRRVPFPAAQKRSSGRGAVSHLPKKQFVFPQKQTARRKYSPGVGGLKKLSLVIAAAFAALSLVAAVTEYIAAPEPEYVATAVYEDYVPAGAGEASGIPAVEARTVYDDHGVTVTVNSFGLLYGEPALDITVTNTSSRNVTVAGNYTVVNGYVLQASGMYCEAGSGETVRTYLRLDEEDLLDAGIDTVGAMTLCFALYDSDDFSDIAAEVQVAVETEAGDFVQQVDDSGRLLWEQDGVRLLFREARIDDWGDATLYFFAENTTDHQVIIQTESVLLNDCPTDGILWCQLLPDTRCIGRMYLFDLEAFGVESLEDMEQIRLDLEIANPETWEVRDTSVLIETVE